MSGPSPPSRPFWKAPPVVGAVLSLVLVLLFELAMARSSGEPGQAVLFLGRFHPLIVHLPIGIWVLVAAAEAASLVPKLRARIDPALGLALPLLVASTVAAFVLGHFLGKAGGFPRHGLTLHRRLELGATIGTALCLLLWAYQARRGTSRARWAYRGVLGASLGLLSIGAHFGGTLTRGETYLSKYAPGFLKPLLGGGGEPAKEVKPAAPAPPAAEPLLYADVVQPLLKKYCVECHGAEKQKGKLRLDSLAELQKGGENGPVVVAGASNQSPLAQRMLLPPENDDRMPPEGEPAPSRDEIALIGFWIDRGANDALRVRDMLVPDGARQILQNSLAPGSAPPSPPRAPPPEPTPPSTSAAETPPPAPTEPNRAAPDQGAPAEAAAPAQPAAKVDPAPAATAGLSAPAILEAKCGKCHGPNRQKGKLRVDSIEALLRGGKRGPGMVPGHPEKSAIIQRVLLPLAHDEHMPPPAEPQLDPAEIATLQAWVRRQAGAVPAPRQASTSPAPAAASGPAPSSEPAPVAPSAPAGEPTVQTSTVTAAEPSRERAELLARLPATVRLFPDAVQPILMDRCGECHAGAAPKADLDVSSIAKLHEGGWSGPAVVPGKPEQSLIVQRARLPETDDDRMPPPGAPPIKQGELELVEVWIAGGARADTTAETKTLSPSALEVLSETFQHRPPPGQATAPARSGGCAACTVGDTRAPPFEALALSLAAAGAFLLRRRR